MPKGSKPTMLVTRRRSMWECEECERTFSGRTAFRLHLKIRHPEAEQSVNAYRDAGPGVPTCGTCGSEVRGYGKPCAKGCRRW